MGPLLEKRRLETGRARRLALPGHSLGKKARPMKVFLDSSALAKRYIEETGSGAVDLLLAEASSLGVCVTCAPEILSALCRRVRESQLNREQYERSKQALLADLVDAEVIPLAPEVIAHAVRLLEKNPLRAMDALQVGSAAEWDADLFVSADKKQLRAAAKYGLKAKPV